MIKNILYSLFLHFILLLLVYANFNLKNNDSKRSSEISVSLISIAGTQDPNANKPSENTKSEPSKTVPKEETSKAAESQKKSNKNKVATIAKKTSKTKAVEAPAKPIIEKAQPTKEAEKPVEKPQEKPPEKAPEKPEETPQEDKKIVEAKKDQDIGAEKKAEEKTDSDNDKNVSNKSDAKEVQNLDNIDLSAREKFNIQSQLKRCYSRAVSETNYQHKTKIMVQVSINEEGVIDSDIDDLIDLEKYNDPKEIAYKISVDNARRALELCSPIRNLPVEKYEIWKKVVLEFGDDS